MQELANKDNYILIFKSQLHSLQGLESYLKQRNYAVFACTDMNEAIRYLLKFKPTYCLVSANLPNRIVSDFINLVQKYNTTKSIAFCENNSVAAYEAVVDMESDLKLFPPVSGLAFERLIADKNPQTNVAADLNNKQTNEAPTKDATIRQTLLLQKSVMAAIDKSVVSLSASSNVVKLNKITNLYCIVLQSKNYFGYLFIASSLDHNVDLNLVKNIKKNFYTFLQTNGEKFIEEKILNIEVKETPFMSLIKNQAEFLKKAVHYSEEIALGYFSQNRIMPHFEESIHEDMAAIRLDEINCDRPLDFDLYLHMPLNNKTLMYTMRGFYLYENQKSKLLDAGIKHLHVKKAQITEQNLKNARQFLHEKIKVFEKADKTL